MPIRVYYEVLNQKGTPALYSDNYAQRPAAGYQGRIFNSPDTGQIFYDTGTTWTLLADAGVGSGSLASVCANGNTTATGISITAGGLSTNDFTNTGFASSVGYVWFAGTGGQMTGTQSFFWDNNNKWLGLGTNTPTAPFDIHTTGNIGIQINNTTTADSKIAFLNADVGKWRIGNLYSGGANLFHIYNNAGVTLAMQINSSNAALFYGSLSSNSFMQTNGGISLIHNATPTSAGYTGIGGLTAGLSIALASGFNQTLTFPTGVSYTYTFPSATGTLINASSFTTNYHTKYSSTAGVLTASMLTDDGTTLQSIGATRSNLYLQAANNTYYGQIAFTNGSNGSFGGISYNNANQYMQFETNSSEWMRLSSTGSLGIGSTSPYTILELKTSIPVMSITPSAYSGSYRSFFGAKADAAGIVQLGNNNDNYIVAGNTATGGYLRFVVNTTTDYITSQTGTIAMTITANAKVGIGVGAPSSTLEANGDIASIGTSSSLSWQDRSGSGRFSWYAPNGNFTYLYNTSNIGQFNMSSGAYTALSDINKKKDFEDSTIGLNEILQLKPTLYRMSNDSENTPKTLGFIAQQVKDFIPQAYVENDGFIGLNDRPIIAGLVKAVQELNDKIENLN